MAAFFLSLNPYYLLAVVGFVLAVLAGVAVEAIANAPVREDLPNEGN